MNTSQIKFALNNIYEKEINNNNFDINGLLDLKKVSFIMLDRDNNIYTDIKTRRFEFDFSNSLLYVYYGRYKNGEFIKNTETPNEYISFDLLSSFVTTEKIGEFGNIQPRTGVRVNGLPDEYILNELGKKFKVKFYNGDDLLKTISGVKPGIDVTVNLDLDKYYYDSEDDCYHEVGWLESGKTVEDDSDEIKDINNVGKVIKNTNFYLTFKPEKYYKITFIRVDDLETISSYSEYFAEDSEITYNDSLYTKTEGDSAYDIVWKENNNIIDNFGIADSNKTFIVELMEDGKKYHL